MPTKRDIAIQKLRQAGIAPSEPRIAVTMFLDGNTTHPTADTVYRTLAAHYPTLSKTTVYNILKRFADLHVIQQINIEDGERRYDPDTSPHAHFKCRRCGKVADIFTVRTPPCPETPGIARVDHAQTLYYGVCTDCG